MKEPKEPASMQDEIIENLAIAQGRMTASGIQNRLIKFPVSSVSKMIELLSDLADAGRITRHQDPGQRALYSMEGVTRDLQPKPAPEKIATPSPSPSPSPAAVASAKPAHKRSSNTRDTILRLIREKPCTNGALVKVLGISTAAVSQHTNKLVARKLIERDDNMFWHPVEQKIHVAPQLEKPVPTTPPDVDDDLQKALSRLSSHKPRIEQLARKIAALGQLIIFFSDAPTNKPIADVLEQIRSDLLRLSA